MSLSEHYFSLAAIFYAMSFSVLLFFIAPRAMKQTRVRDNIPGYRWGLLALIITYNIVAVAFPGTIIYCLSNGCYQQWMYGLVAFSGAIGSLIISGIFLLFYYVFE